MVEAKEIVERFGGEFRDDVITEIDWSGRAWNNDEAINSLCPTP
jgi:hypothetical protein